MKSIRRYRWFKRFKAIIAPVLMFIMLASQFPLSSHCYKALFGSHHSDKMVCMKDGTCMMNMANGQNVSCDCHAKNADRPFFCSCNSSTNLNFTLQLSKVLLPEPVTGEVNLRAVLHSSSFKKPDLPSRLKDIFHPPQVA